MKRIDFLGAHGVGKSTIFDHLLQGREQTRWLTRMEAKRRVATEEILDGRSPKGLAKAVTCHLPGLGDIFVNAYTLRPAERAFARESGPYAEFFEHCLLDDLHRAQRMTRSTVVSARRPGWFVSTMLQGDNRRSLSPVQRKNTPVRHINLSWIFHRLSELCLMDSLDETVIFDESLSHNTTGILLGAASDLKVRTYFDKMPPPHAVVHISAPESEVFRRLIRRCDHHGTALLRYASLDEPALRRQIRRALRISEIGACTLQWRGVRVLSVDALDPPQINAEKIADFVAG